MNQIENPELLMYFNFRTIYQMIVVNVMIS